MTQAAPTSPPIPGVRKAAVLLLTLPEDDAAAVLKRLPPGVVEVVSRELAGLVSVSPQDRRAVFGEFYQLALANNYLSEGGLDHVRNLLKKSLSGEDADRMIRQVTSSVQATPFGFLQKAETANLLAFIQEEHPQTIALILAHLPPAKASEVLTAEPHLNRLLHRPGGEGDVVDVEPGAVVRDVVLGPQAPHHR